MSQTIRQRIWTGDYEAADIAELEARYRQGQLNGSSFSSAVYSYAGRLKAEGDEKGYRRYLAKALETSDTFANMRKSAMTTAELDVRQSILREAGRYLEAGTVIEEGLRKFEEEGTAPIHTKALLLIGKANVLEHTNVPVGEVQTTVKAIEELAPEVEEEDEYQAIRVYRALAKHYSKMKDTERAEEAVADARRLIYETGAWDQERKLEHDLRS